MEVSRKKPIPSPLTILMNHVQQLFKKKNWHAKYLYAIHLSVPTWLKRFNIFKNLFLSEYFKKGDFGGF